MSKQLKSMLALVLCVAMLLSIGVVMPAAAADPVDIGHLHESATAPTQSSAGEITLVCDNAYPADWTNFYADSADCVRLIKSGSDAVYNIGALTEYGTEDGIVVSHNNNELIVRNSQWNLNCAAQSGISPLEHGDTLIVGGTFTNGSNAIRIQTTYITKDADGNIHCSETFETGRLSNPNTDGDYICFNTEYKAYTATWSNFKAEEAGNVKVLRDGTAYDIGALTEYGTTDGIFVTRNGNLLAFRNSQWNLNCAGQSGLTPFAAGDIYYIGGNFSDGTETFHVDPIWFTKDADGNITEVDAPEEPEDVIELGVMKAAADTQLKAGGFYFTMDANAMPYDEGWANEWLAESADCIKLLRGTTDEAEAVSIAQTSPGRAPFIKYDESGYYFNTDTWHIGDSSPIVAGDILIIEGNFTRGDLTAHVSKSVVVCNADGTVSFCTEVPVPPVVIEAGIMKAGSNTNLINGSFYFSMDDNDIPYTEDDWGNAFTATSADCIRLIRGGGTEADAVSIAQTYLGRAPFVKYSKNNYYFDAHDAWHLGDYAPLQPGDILIVEGEFTNGDVTFRVSKSVIVIGEDGAVSFYTEVPVPPVVIEAGAMSAADNTSINNGGFYFTMAENDLPYVTDWSTRFYATSADCIRLTRNGETASIGQTTPGRSPIIKYGETAYYFDGGSAWFIGDAAPLTVGDVLCVEGEFTDGTNNFTIEKTYISFNWDGSVSFSLSEPEAPVKPFADTQELTVAVWNGSFHNFGMKQMYDLRMAGINTIIGIEPYWLGSSDSERNTNMNKLLDLASLYGIKVYPKLQTNDGMWDGETVPGYNTRHAAIAGFLIQDEPSYSELAHLADLKEAYDANAAFTGKEFLVNLYPASSGNIHIGGDYADYVDTFIEEVNPDTIAVDIYPLNASGNVRKIFFENLAILADRAKANGCKLQYTMLACAHQSGSTNYAVPSAAELRWYYDVAMAFGANEFVQYIYASHDDGYNTAFNMSGAISNETLYGDLATVNAEHAAWADTYASYTYIGTAAVNNDSNPMINSFSEYAAELPAGISATGDILVGIFGKDDETAYMITNAGKAASDAATEFVKFEMNGISVTIEDCDSATVITEGESKTVEAVSGTVTIPVPAYEGVFVICSRSGGEDPDDPPVPVDPCEGYTDVNRSQWYHAAVDFVLERELMGSTQTGKLTFEPNTSCTRAMIATMLYSLEGKPAVSYQAKFPDVKDGQWYTPAVMWAYQSGVVTGYDNGNFGPNDKVTREQMAVILKAYTEKVKELDTSKTADLSKFADTNKVTWSKSYIQWAVAEGLLSGKANGGKTYLDPQGFASRAEVAAILRSFILNILEAK